MANSTRIPRTPVEMDVYLKRSKAYLPENAKRLGILDDEVTQWLSYCDRWEPIFPLYMDKRRGYTVAIKDELYSIIDEVVAFDKSVYLLDRIATSPASTSEDLEVFGIRTTTTKVNTVPQVPITEFVKAQVQPISGGTISVKCIGSANSRAAIIDRADSVQYVYFVGTTPPSSPEEVGLTKEVSSRATFSVNAGAGNTGKTLYIYFRWYNVKHPEYAGPWSALYTTLIL